MSFTESIYTQFIAIQAILPQNDLYTVILENNASGQPIYIGRSTLAGAPTNASVWAITKLVYDVNGFLTNVNLPTSGQGFKYVWDNRATYF